MKMKMRNEQLRITVGNLPKKEVVKEVVKMPKYDSVNRQGYAAYSLDDRLKLLTMLNTLMLQPQFYRSENEQISELRDLIHKIALEDAYFVAQCIVWSRCCGEGLRSVNHLAAVLLAPFASCTEWGKRFYGAFNKKTKNSGGCIYRLDDMQEIKDAFSALNKSALTNAMKKGFASVLLNANAYELCKYRKTTIDIANLVHPNVKKAAASVEIDGTECKVIDALMKGLSVSADTWETAQSEAGQIVAKAVKEGKLSKEKAEEVLKEAKNENWKGLLQEGKLGILAAIRNLRNILKGNDSRTVSLVASLVQNGNKIRAGKIMPYQLEQAMTVVQEIGGTDSRMLLQALEKGMVTALPNLKEQLPGKTLIMIDCSGSMTTAVYQQGDSNHRRISNASCIDKAAILGAMLAKGVNADVIRFGSDAEWFNYNPNDSLLSIAHSIAHANMGGTNISAAFDLITKEQKAYNRIILLSDDEANYGCTRSSYKTYITRVCSPYVYSVDLCGYGSVPLKNKGKVNYYCGYGYAMLDDVARLEFNPEAHIDKVRSIRI